MVKIALNTLTIDFLIAKIRDRTQALNKLDIPNGDEGRIRSGNI